VVAPAAGEPQARHLAAPIDSEQPDNRHS
jgi:hypothetical protein